jgi:hypothetical protein
MHSCEFCFSPGNFITQFGRRIFICSNSACHHGRGYRGAAASEVRTLGGYRTSDSVCRPTTCPRCFATGVFFIRHNGGSTYVNPPLGRPWDVHECFRREPTGQIRIANEVKQRDGRYGVAKSSFSLSNERSTILCVETEGENLLLKLRGDAGGFLVGNVVLFQPSDRSVVSVENVVYRFSVLVYITDQDTTDQRNSKCPYCQEILPESKLLEHLNDVHSHLSNE